MKYLLDAHTFLWWDTSSKKLSSSVFALFEDETNTLLLSLVSIWEIQIKQQLGKLTLIAPLAEIIEKQRQDNQIELLPITLPHILSLENLPLHHRDPFDRLLIAQAQIEDVAVLTNDPLFAQYPVRVIW
jgi:PIN domain nuclease of toxin-antitoxin system